MFPPMTVVDKSAHQQDAIQITGNKIASIKTITKTF